MNNIPKPQAKLAAIQMTTGPNIEQNLANAESQLIRAVGQGANIIALPEVFACYDGEQYTSIGSEEMLPSGPLRTKMSAWAREHQVYLIGGTIPVLEPEIGKVYPRCYLYSDDGEEIGYYDKIHLFDVDIDDAQGSYRESDRFIAGNQIKVFPTRYGNIGLSICYDLRFPALFEQLRAAGADIISVVAAFTDKTGRAHWKPLLQARAIEQQCYILAANQWGQHDDKRRTYGHSMVVSPWGEVLDQLPEGEGFVCADMNIDELEKIRKEMPVIQHKRLFYKASF